MGIYWCAVNLTKKEKIKPPRNQSVKMPSLIHPENCFSRMLVLLLQNDWYMDKVAVIGDTEDLYYDDNFTDVSQKVLDNWHTTYGTKEPCNEWFEKSVIPIND